MRLFMALPLLAGSACPAMASPLTFEQALERAQANAPAITARTAEVSAREASAIAAGQLPDPRLSLGFDNLPVSGPPAFTLDGSMMTAQRVGLQQDVPNLAKRHAREAEADAATGVAQARSAVTRLDVKVATAAAWIDLAYAGKRLTAIEDVLDRLGPLMPVAEAGVASGSARPGQSLRIRQAIAGLEDRRSTILAEREQARAMLERWTGDDEPQAQGSIPGFAFDPAELRLQIESNPRVRAADAGIGAAQAGADLARAGKRPDWGVSLSFGHRDPAYGNVVSVGASMTLPLFPGKRQNPRIEAAEADVSAARARREDTRRALAAELERGLATHAMQLAQWRRAHDTLLPLARQEADLETASYGAGRVGLIDVVSAETALAETELDVLDREARVTRQAAILLLTFGGDER
ncbi:TolC family protein [Novosphingobium beihaiensis]|uniref:TolC family protein n=1 Tax=Novosphingobium beihaiensis TaxID=2930389 RepID=A0ABT0BRH4_9SPHN|nr:TolC family protein [Novosphingobium beihaiensis]MCJ2187659.1 TolC family protein [Novosphingobium beihaiensis]